MEYINVFSAGSKAYSHLTARSASPSAPPTSSSSSALSGGVIAIIVITALIEIGLTIWGIVALVQFWKFLPTIPAVLSLLLLVFGFAPFSLLVTYLARR